MKILEFSVARMIGLMIEDYSFCEAFADQGFSADVNDLIVAHSGGKINYKAERALRGIYKNNVTGDEKATKIYNEVVVAPVKNTFLVKLIETIGEDNSTHRRFVEIDETEDPREWVNENLVKTFYEDFDEELREGCCLFNGGCNMITFLSVDRLTTDEYEVLLKFA